MTTTLPSQGTHFSDGVRTGPILGSQYAAGNNVLSPPTMTSSPIDTQPDGIFNTPTSLLDIIPATVNTAGVAAAQALVAAGYLTLASTNINGRILLSSYAGISSVLQLGNARNITVRSTDNDSGVNFTVFGWDEYGMPLAEQIAGPNNGTTQGKKAFKYIRAVYGSAATVGANLSIGWGDIFGIPYYIPNANAVFTQKYNGALDAGTTVVGIRAVATATTGDVRGTYTPASASDGVKRLTLNIYNASGDARVSNSSNADFSYLNTDPITTTNLSAVVSVSAIDHQLTAGETITIAGAATTNAITAAQLNITTTVLAITDANTFTYTSNGTANNTAAGGGTGVYLTPAKGNLYITPIGRFGVSQYNVALF